jgi:NTE family protein
VATDTVSGETVALAQGDLGVALRASAAIPGLFAPVELNGRLLVDGGLVDNLPIDVAKTMQADVIIAVDLGQPLTSRERPNSMISIIDSSIGVESTRSRTRTADANVIIRPDVGRYGCWTSTLSTLG